MNGRNRKLYALTALVMLTLCACNTREDISKYAPVEIYADDTLLQQIDDKRAMIVIAHDDDMCGMAGTISLLNQQGWEIAVVSFSQSPERNAAQILACRDILDTVMFVDLKPGQYRNDLDSVENAYYAIPPEKFEAVFNRALIEEEYIRCIRAFNPSVIFTLDNEMGGYGHPEHVFISQIVIDLAAQQRIAPAWIYQSVYTDHMEQTIMERHAARMKSWGFPGDEWDNAKAIYGVSGMPEPDVQINIRSQAGRKMDYLRSYNKREREILDFFIPFFEAYPAKEYFSVFDREFFRVIKV
jgi:LmbE family N-acetylglucosaminyl deacetylase